MAYLGHTKQFSKADHQSNVITVALLKALNLYPLSGNINVNELAELIAENIGGGGGTGIVDDHLSTTSKNPVQNKVITGALDGKVSVLTSAPTQDNTSGKIDIVLLSAEPSAKYNGYIYIIDTGASPSTPTDIVGDTIVLGSDEDISNNTIELGENATISDNTIYF